MLAEAGDCHLLIIQGVSEIHGTILEVCFMYTTDSSFLGGFWVGRRSLNVRFKFIHKNKTLVYTTLIPHFDVLLTVHLSMILVTNLMHKILFYIKFIICLYIF